MANKFQEMLEYLVNEDREKAEEIFHEIVVEKSRSIYENLLSEEMKDDDDDEEEEVEESLNDEYIEEEDMDMDMDTTPSIGGDPSDDMEMDMDADMDMDSDMDSDMDMDADDDAPATQGDIKDLESELADLKAEFEELLSSKEDMGDDDMEDMEDDDMEDMEDDDMEDEEETDESMYSNSAFESRTAAEQMREYVEKVSQPSNSESGANTKSTVASKNDMGGTASNLAQGGEADTKGTAGGLANPSTKEDNMGNVNVPGAKASKSMKAMPKGHGSEKKGQGETAANKKSIIGSR